MRPEDVVPPDIAACLEEADSSTDLGELGAVPVTAATVDINGDGVPDTLILASARSLLVLTDHAGDGFADCLTVVDDTGPWAAWDFLTTRDGGGQWILVGSAAFPALG